MQNFELIFFENNRDTFDNIKIGLKDIETRAGTNPKTKQKYNYSAIKQDDIITFICGEDNFQKKVKSIRKYKTLDNFLEKENLYEIFGRDIDKDEARNIYLNFPNNYPERIRKYGIIAFVLKDE